MSNINISSQFLKIDFINRYRKICERHNEFENRLRGNRKDIYDEVLGHYDYDIKYYKSETFYRLEEKRNDKIFILTLTLKEGLVEVMINVKFVDVWGIPGGRLDFLAQDLDPNFDRNRYNLPKYGNAEELKDILDGIFNIYEDMKREFEG